MQTRPKRYQECGFWRRRWRDRYLLVVPFTACRIYARHRNGPDHVSLGVAWSIARGFCDVDRRYWYTTAEVKAMERKCP